MLRHRGGPQSGVLRCPVKYLYFNSLQKTQGMFIPHSSSTSRFPGRRGLQEVVVKSNRWSSHPLNHPCCMKIVLCRHTCLSKVRVHGCTFTIHKILLWSQRSYSSLYITSRAKGPSLDPLVLPDRSSDELITRYEGHRQLSISTVDIQHQHVTIHPLASRRQQHRSAEGTRGGPDARASAPGKCC